MDGFKDDQEDTVQDGAADLQHGIRVYGDSHLCIKGHSPR